MARKKYDYFQAVKTSLIAATLEVIINHPLWSIKTILQKQKLNSGLYRKYTKISLESVYRGFPLHLLSRAPITALQIALSNAIKGQITNLHPVTRDIIAGISAASICAFILTPTELIMIHQLKSGGRFWDKAVNIASANGIIGMLTGYVGTAVRIGAFTCGFFAITPALKRNMQKNGVSNLNSSIIGSCIAGIAAATFSNGFDVIKTLQQSELLSQQLTVRAAAKAIYREDGVAGFFKGFSWHAARACTGIMIIEKTVEYMMVVK